MNYKTKAAYNFKSQKFFIQRVFMDSLKHLVVQKSILWSTVERWNISEFAFI